MAECNVIAHRGANIIAPQNTIEAFKMSMEIGCDGFETDIHLTKDGIPVVCHNFTIDETSNGTGAIKDMTLEELREFDFGSYKCSEYAGVKIPTLDEFLEFPKNVIEMMRQPLEDGHVTISRLQGSYTFPCDIMLVAAMNPCPCGYYPDMSKCKCTGPQIERYLKKLSEPMLDRMDMSISVPKLKYDELYGETKEESSEDIRKRKV